MKYIALIYAMIIFFMTPFTIIRLIRSKKNSKLYFMAVMSLFVGMIIHPFCIIIAIVGNWVGLLLSIITLIEIISGMIILSYFFGIEWYVFKKLKNWKK